MKTIIEIIREELVNGFSFGKKQSETYSKVNDQILVQVKEEKKVLSFCASLFTAWPKDAEGKDLGLSTIQKAHKAAVKVAEEKGVKADSKDFPTLPECVQIVHRFNVWRSANKTRKEAKGAKQVNKDLLAAIMQLESTPDTLLEGSETPCKVLEMAEYLEIVALLKKAAKIEDVKKAA